MLQNEKKKRNDFGVPTDMIANHQALNSKIWAIDEIIKEKKPSERPTMNEIGGIYECRNVCQDELSYTLRLPSQSGKRSNLPARATASK